MYIQRLDYKGIRKVVATKLQLPTYFEGDFLFVLFFFLTV